MVESSARPREFGGTSRFGILRQLGAGGMGTVYEAVDREQNTRVALKTLMSLDPQWLLRFKNEFRALQDVHHRNLVSLGELLEHDGRWFFTMELVHGVPFDHYVRTGAPSQGDFRLRTETTGP